MPDVLVYLAAIIYFSSFTILPVVLILVGIIRRRKANGIVFFMTGSVFASGLICAFIPNDNLFPIFFFLFLLIFFGLFLFIRNFGISKLENRARYFIRTMQNDSFPSCEEELMTRIKEVLVHSPAYTKAKDVNRVADTLVYDTSLDIVSSPRYRDLGGSLTSTGMQMLCICKNALESFLQRGYISLDKYKTACDYLRSCEEDFDSFTCIW